jgi:sugar lactone lactonase YvrE
LTTSIEVTAVAEVGADLGEGPCWDQASNTLLFVDVTAGIVYRYRPNDGTVTRFAVGQEVGAAIPRASGGLVLALRDGIAVVDSDGDPPRIVAPIEGDNAGNRMNDARCDPAGRLWAGTMAFDFEPGAAALYRVERDYTYAKVVDRVTISNGLGWSPDGTAMYYIDSAENAVDVFDYDVDEGCATGRRRLVSVPRAFGMPDGMTVDSEGHLWVAMFGGGRVVRYTPAGEVATTVTLPVTQVTSVTFGGSDLADMFITTAACRLDADELRSQPLAGATFVCRPGATGRPATVFEG